MFKKKKIIQVKIDTKKFLQGHREGIFHIIMCRPAAMPDDEFKDIKKRFNSILDDIKKYL